MQKKNITKEAATKRSPRTKTRTPQEQMIELRRNLISQLPEGTKLRHIAGVVHAMFEPADDQLTRALAVIDFATMLQQEQKRSERIFVSFIASLVAFAHVCETPEQLREMMNEINAVRARNRAHRLAAGKRSKAAKKGGVR